MLELDFARFPVLVVDDEQDNLDAFRFAFRKTFNLRYAQGGAEALALLETCDAAAIVTDQRMPGMSGIELLRQAIRRRPDVVGILLTAYTDLPVLLEAINSGAVHRYVQKPWDSKELTVILRQAIERFSTLRENRVLRDQLARYAGYLEGEQADPLEFGELSTESPAMSAAVASLDRLSPLVSPVVVLGEPGTERELFARAIHVSSPREGKPFVNVRCGATEPDERLLRELAGFTQGAFEGALSDRPGRIELADGGTLVLHDFRGGTELEARLLALFEAGRTQRLGAEKPITVDVRVIFCTSYPMSAVVTNPGLAPLLGGAHIVVPPLRERRTDIPLLAARMLARFGRTNPSGGQALSEDALDKLTSYEWPGNVRELANVIERATMLSGAGIVRGEHIAMPEERASSPSGIRAGDADAEGRVALPTQLDDIERRELSMALSRCGGNKAEVARVLGIQRTTLYYRLKRLGIEV